MSHQNVEIVRAMFDGAEAFADGRDPGAAFEAVGGDAMWIPAPEVPGLSSYRGLGGLAEFLRSWTESFDSWSLRLERAIDAGDDRVVAVGHQWGVGKASGVRVDVHFGMVFQFEDGRLVQARVYMDPADAFADAGLAP